MKKLIVFCVLVLFGVGYAFAQNPTTLDSLDKLLKTNISNQQRADTYNKIAEEYRFSDSSKVNTFANKAINLSQQIDYPEGIADAYYFIGWVAMMRGYYSKAIVLFNKVLSISEEAVYDKGKSNAYNGLGFTHHYKNIYNKALDYYFKALEIDEKRNDSLGMTIRFNNIGLTLMKSKEYKQAIENHIKSQNISKKIKDLEGVAFSYKNLGWTYLSLKNYSEALKNLKKALREFSKINQRSKISETHILLGKVYIALEADSQALLSIKKGMQIAKVIGHLTHIRDGAAILAKIHEKSGNFKEAFRNHQLFKQMADSLNNQENIKKLTITAIEHKFEKEKKDLKHRLEQEKKDLKHQQAQKRSIYLSIGTVMLIILLAAFIILANERKNIRKLKQANQKTVAANQRHQHISVSLENALSASKKQRQKIRLHNNQMKEANQQLRSQDTLIKLLFSELEHRVGNNLVAIKSQISNIYHKVNDPETKKSLHVIENYTQKLWSIQHLFNYPFMLQENSKGVQQNKMMESLTQMITAVYDIHFFDKSNQLNIEINISIPTMEETRFSLIAFCAYELTTNACKYAFRGNNNTDSPRIRVELLKKESNIKLIFSNNGKNITPILFNNEKKFIFENIGSSKGLRIIKHIAELENGQFTICTAGVHERVTKGSRFECTYQTSYNNETPEKTL